jgi:hypothetical protein
LAVAAAEKPIIATKTVQVNKAGLPILASSKIVKPTQGLAIGSCAVPLSPK